jgi:excisionase family DNA binding protein
MWSVKQAAELMGISEQRLRRLLKEGRIKGKKLNGTWVVLELGYKHKRGYNPSKGGHAPGHLREAFLDYINNQFAEDKNIEKAYIGEGEPVSIHWLIGQLWNCTDILPNIEIDTLEGLGIENVFTYAQAVRALSIILETEKRTPEVKT